MAKRVEQFTFKDSGQVVGIQKVSPLLMIRLRERFPAPKPPKQQVDYGDGKVVYEENPAHPEYRDEVLQYEQDMELKIRRMLIKRGVIIDWNDDKKAELENVRAFWRETFEEELDADDDVAFVSYVCVGSDSDLEEFIEALLKRSQPTEEAVNEASARFQG